jgi:uracil permease
MAPMEAAIAIGAVAVKDVNGNVVGQMANLWILPIGMAMVGAVYCIVALFIKLFGVGWLNKLLPPIVVGPVIMVIGLSLAGSAVGNLTGSASGTYNLIKILCGLIAMVSTALAAHYGKGTVALIPFIIGMAAGYVAAGVFTGIGYYGLHNDYFHVVDFDPIVSNFNPIRFPVVPRLSAFPLLAWRFLSRSDLGGRWQSRSSLRASQFCHDLRAHWRS